jgi:cytochrome c556
MMKRVVIAAGILFCGIGGVLAADVIAQRRALMHDDGIAAKKLFDMAKGSAPFDLAVAQASLKTLANGAEKSPALFPDDSKTGGGTAALPTVWQNKADFDARFVKFSKDVEEAIAKTRDEASFKAIAPRVFENCSGCHELYKAKSS